jgi:hypothetical protein
MVMINPGICAGWLGKSGLYFLFRPGIVKIHPDYDYREQLENTSSLYLDNFTNDILLIKKSELITGISKRLTKNSFILLGMGYVHYNTYQRLVNNNTLRISKKEKYSFVDVFNLDFNGLGIDLEYILRIRNKILVTFQTTCFIDTIWSSDYETGIRTSSLTIRSIDLKLGLGYSF